MISYENSRFLNSFTQRLKDIYLKNWCQNIYLFSTFLYFTTLKIHSNAEQYHLIVLKKINMLYKNVVILYMNLTEVDDILICQRIEEYVHCVTLD